MSPERDVRQFIAGALVGPVLTAVLLLVAIPAFAGAGAGEPADPEVAASAADGGGWEGNTNFGDQTKPQPLSGADENGTGANPGDECTHDYCSTRDGSMGGNGQENDGHGEAVGQPCAGCVGSADNKNPPGQYPNGSDSNSGYECDGRDRVTIGQQGNGNHGIGDTNPAHTGCEDTSTTGSTTTGSGSTGTTGCPSTSTGMSTGGSTTGCGTTTTGKATTSTTGNGTTGQGTTGQGTTGQGTTGGPTTGGPTTTTGEQVAGVVLQRPGSNPTTGSGGAAPLPAIGASNPARQQVAGVQMDRGPLAATGSTLLPLAATGLGSLATGLGAIAAVRRRRDDASTIDIAERLEGHLL